MINQLRIYRIEPNLKTEFDLRFKTHAIRIMKKYGFQINAMWYSQADENTEFVYVLQWPDESTLKNQWELFMADEEWIEIKRQSREKYGEMVLVKVLDKTLRATDWFTNFAEN